MEHQNPVKVDETFVSSDKSSYGNLIRREKKIKQKKKKYLMFIFPNRQNVGQ